jgi:FMN phosphatase YigB (HAD superfamily)
MALSPEEVLFFDDNQANIDAATAIGMVAQLVSSPSDVRSVLEEFGVLRA